MTQLPAGNRLIFAPLRLCVDELSSLLSDLCVFVSLCSSSLS
jgi:hypothetical protein